MSDPESDPNDLRALGERLHKARERLVTKEEEPQASKLGVGFRLLTELTAAVVVGMALGWSLDWFFGTSPILFSVMFVFGLVTGFRNVVRTARKMDRDTQAKDRRGD